MPLQRVPINNFRGGLNTRDGPFDLQPNESPDLLNVTISNLVGQLQVRRGKQQFDDGSMDNKPHADNMQQIVLGTSTRLIMLSMDGAIYSCDMSGALTLRHTGTVATIWAFAQYPDASGADHVWCMNGVDTPQKWDGAAGTTSNWTATTGSLPNGKMVKVFQNKLIVGNVAATPQRLYLSAIGDPEAVTTAYGFLDLRGPEDELDTILDFADLGNRLYVFKRESVWVINDAFTLSNRRLGRPGVADRFQIAEMNSKLYWFNGQGLWSTGGVAIAYEAGSIQNWFPDHLNYAAISTVRIVTTRDAYERLFLAVPTGINTVPDTIIEVVPNINFRRIGGRRYLLLPAFFIHTIPVQSFCNINITGNSGWQVIVSSSDTQHKLYTVFAGSDDDGTEISAYWKSSWMAIQGEEPFERVRRLNVELFGDAIADVFADFKLAPDFSEVLPDPDNSNAAIWDDGVQWDDGTPWDPSGVYRFARVRPESRGRFHQVQFRTVTGGTPFLINVAELAIRGGKEH